MYDFIVLSTLLGVNKRLLFQISQSRIGSTLSWQLLYNCLATVVFASTNIWSAIDDVLLFFIQLC
jgi:hypothetical protein